MALAPIQEMPAEHADPTAQGRIVMTKIFVTGLKVEAQIGVYAHEKGRAQPLVVDVELDVPTAGIARLADTVNYEMIGEAARAIAAEGHIGLVEALERFVPTPVFSRSQLSPLAERLKALFESLPETKFTVDYPHAGR